MVLYSNTNPEIQVGEGKIVITVKDLRTLGFPGGSVVKNPPVMQETQVRSLGWEDSLK